MAAKAASPWRPRTRTTSTTNRCSIRRASSYPSAVDHRGLGVANGQGAVGHNAGRDLAGHVQRLARRHHMAHQTEVVGVGGRQQITRQDHLHGIGIGNLSLEPHGRAGACDQPLCGFRQAEDSLLLGDPNVGLLQHFTTTAQTGTVDRGDQRGADSILGAVVNSERNIPALQVAVDRTALPDRESTAEAAQDCRPMLIDHVQ